VRRLRLLALVLAFGVVIALPTVANANHKDTTTGRANLHPVPLSQEEDNGVVPGSLSGVRGKFTFQDDGNNITMSGEAWGLDPAATYLSLIGDIESVPGGFIGFGAGASRGACEQLAEDLEGKSLVGEGGFLFTWVVDADGHGTVTGANFLNEELLGNGAPPFPPGTYVSLDEFDTISIVQVEPDLGNGVVACGQVATHPAR